MMAERARIRGNNLSTALPPDLSTSHRNLRRYALPSFHCPTRGNVQVVGPMYTIQRPLRAFAQPDDFIPERWITQPELIFNTNAFVLFLLGGRYFCIGK
ncbi:hypothetical protein F4778DRAFT_466717 [Xylariomycetidae sp. FL2044]|nr:hypothetical protein F4778DRAFT_466717 [Xylariomycetidae sp. FL2044]